MNDLKETIERVRELDAKATKGPFTVSDDDLIEVQREGVHIARFPTVESFPCLDPEYDDLNAVAAELKANAELFAHYRTAAPKLATACEDLLAENAKKDERIRELEKALKKATACDCADVYVADSDCPRCAPIVARDSRKQCDALEAAQKENARLRGLIEWQPIETAPKDGTTVLLWGNGFVIPYAGNYVSRPTKAAPLARYWIMRGAGATWSARNQPTKWLSLPPAPANPNA